MTVATTIKRRATSRSAWVLPKEESCIAPEEIWSNKGAAIS
jgi:NCS1 family nucleobase:cation symporter-1